MDLLARADILFRRDSYRVALANLPYNLTICWPFITPSGKAGLQSRFLVQDGICIVALDKNTHEAYMVQQTRIVPEGSVESVEFPCGGAGTNEEPITGGLREPREEAQVVPTENAQILPLFEYKNPVIGPLVTNQHAYLVTSARRVQMSEPHEEGDENISKVLTLPLSDIIRRRREAVMADPLLTFALALLAQQVLREEGLEHLLT